MTLPLAGLRVLAVEQYGAGPFGTQHLADLGAEVIKIENAAQGGDVGRLVGPYFFGEGDSHFFQAFNRNKKSITLDLKSDEGRAALHKLVETSDAVFNNLRGDLPAKLGLDYAALSKIKADIVCVHLSAYGRDGERADWPGYDYLMQAEAGYLSVTGEPGGPPSRFGLSIIDMMTGTMSALALVSAVLGARSTGQGRDIDTSLYEVAMHNLNYLAAWYLNEGVNTGRHPRSAHPSLTPSQLYKTGDGWIFIMCNKEKFWGVMCDAIGKPEWKTDARFCGFKARLAHRDELTAELDAVLSADTTAAWMARFGGKVPASPVHDIGSALDAPFAKARGVVAEVPHPARGTIGTVACPIRCPGDTLPLRPGPALGADNGDILGAIGMMPHQDKETAT
ncbi:CaiB/BaiF CoA transferase family protein [Acidimangrovimonas sediminis]|uniref:CaiB/BaiF CoA transferase family protein n=1 Tax=Acidimangrovimonas sediminis TaxID=2056283 RepID=UPI000C803D9B|nr:CoA transferase [Acidimangrovimonas sediminis]